MQDQIHVKVVAKPFYFWIFFFNDNKKKKQKDIYVYKLINI